MNQSLKIALLILIPNAIIQLFFFHSLPWYLGALIGSSIAVDLLYDAVTWIIKKTKKETAPLWLRIPAAFIVYYSLMFVTGSYSI